MRAFTRKVIVAAIAFPSVQLAIPALAQQAAPKDAVEDAPSKAQGPTTVARTPRNTAPVDRTKGGIEEIVVSATKRSQRLQHVPAAVSALNSAALQERGITTASQLQFVVPSLQVGTLDGATNVTIRGVGDNLAGNNAPPAVSINVDGIYQPLPSIADLSEVDINRVEVLRGPQGTLYGRNANAGAINFISKAPIDEFESYLDAGYASYNESRLQGMVNLPITDKVQARAVVDWQDRRDGFIKNIIPNGQDLDTLSRISGRVRVAAQLTDDVHLDVEGIEQYSTGSQFYFTLSNPPTAAAIAANPYLAHAIVATAPWRTSDNDPVTSNRNYSLLSGTLTWRLSDWLNLKSITAIQSTRNQYVRDDDGTNLSIFPARSLERDNTFTQEVDLNAKIGRFDGVFGVFYLDERHSLGLDYFLNLGLKPLPPGSSLFFNEKPLDTGALGLFADGTFNVTKRLRLIAGIRYSYDKLTETQSNVLNITPTIVVPTCPHQTNDKSFFALTPRGGLQYDLTSDSNVYATVSKGFKDGGYNYDACDQLYQPEKITSYEIGLKNRLLGGRATLNASAFYYDYSNLQINQTVGITQFFSNAPGAIVRGLEFEGAWQPDPHWTVDANLSLLDAKYTNYANTDTLEPQLGPQALDGKRLANAPKETFNLGVAYKTDMFRFGRFTFRGDASQRTTVYFREFNTPADAQTGYTLLNLSLIWDSPNERYRVRVFGNNVTNQPYISLLGGASNNLGASLRTWGDPLQVGAEFKAYF